MIDLGYKAEFEKVDKQNIERLDIISKELDRFLKRLIAKHNLLSSEFMALLNNQMAFEINANLRRITEQKTQQNLSLKNKITNKNNIKIHKN